MLASVVGADQIGSSYPKLLSSHEVVLVYDKHELEAKAVGLSRPQGPCATKAESLCTDGQDGLGKPRPAGLRLADLEPRRVRRLRARHSRDEGLDPRWRPLMHGAAGADAA